MQSEAKKLEIICLVLETSLRPLALCLLYSTRRSGYRIGASTMPCRITGISVKLSVRLLVPGRIHKYSFCKWETMSWRHKLIPVIYRIFVSSAGWTWLVEVVKRV